MDSTNPPPAARLQAISKHYSYRFGLNRKEVLCGIDLEVTAGKAMGLVGPNGSGKSTLQKILAGLERQSSGELTVLGGTLSEGAVRARIGYVPEDAPFPGELSARAVLDLVGSLQGIPASQIRTRGDELLERVGLSEHSAKNLRRYSRGMLRRFSLAQAWLHQPDLILLDEPTAGLDAEGFDVLQDLLEEARGRGATIVFSSHLISDLEDHCDDLVVLADGRVAATGSPAELLSRPACWRLELHSMNETTVMGLREWVESQGGVVDSLNPSGRSLFELYRRTRLSKP